MLPSNPQALLPVWLLALVAATGLMPSGPATAEPYFHRVRDINQFPAPSASSNPSPLVRSGNFLFFTADDGSGAGRGLWTINPNAPGIARPVQEHYQTLPAFRDPLELYDAGGKLYFSAVDSLHGRELWIHDTTTTPQVRRVKDINVGAGDSSPDSFLAAGGGVIFRADDGFHGKELWKTQGTPQTTELIADIFPGRGGSYPQLLTLVGPYVFFRADERLGLYGMELYRTDGTEKGTVLVSDIRPGKGGSYPNFFAVMNNRLFFRANNGPDFKRGYELWSVDSASTDTKVVKDINPGPQSSYPEDLTVVGNRILFSADDGTHGRELWRTDGTAAGTVLVKDIAPGPVGSAPSNLFAVDNLLFFHANENETTYELWRSDGTAEGTIRLRTFQKGTATPDAFALRWLALSPEALFPAYDPATGWELWRSDGTPEGTRILVDVVPGPASSFAFPLGALEETVYFSAEDPEHGREPWRVEPSPAIVLEPSSSLDFFFTADFAATTGTLTRTATIRNDGWRKDLFFTDIPFAIEGPDDAHFHLPVDLPVLVPPGQSVAVAIGFVPTEVRTYSARLVVMSDSPGKETIVLPLHAFSFETGMLLH